jgi:hypothetical protein
MVTIIFYFFFKLNLFLTPEEFKALPKSQQTEYVVIEDSEL